MKYIIMNAPSYPFFVVAGNAAYRPGDIHRKRSGIGYFDLILVEQGALSMEVDGIPYHVTENCVLVIPAEHPHGGTRSCVETTCFHWLHFYSNESYSILDTPKIPKRQGTSSTTINKHDYTQYLVLPVFQVLTPQRAADILAIMKQLESISYSRFEHTTTSIESTVGVLQQQALMLQIFSLLVKKSVDHTVNSTASIIKQYITIHYGEKLSLSKLAEVANCHPTHVIRCTKQQYGITPSMLITKTRLEKADLLLHTTDMTISEIAYNVGFSSPSYFCRTFKKNFGISPQKSRTANIHD